MDDKYHNISHLHSYTKCDEFTDYKIFISSSKKRKICRELKKLSVVVVAVMRDGKKG